MACPVTKWLCNAKVYYYEHHGTDKRQMFVYCQDCGRKFVDRHDGDSSEVLVTN